MREGFRIIDADRHVVEPYDMWSKHLEPEFQKYAPKLVGPPDEPLDARVSRLGSRGLVPLVPIPTVDGKPLWRDISEEAWIAISTVAYMRLGLGRFDNPATYLADMDRTGVDITFLYPGFSMLIEGLVHSEPAVASAFARAYNTWLQGFCAHAPQRLRGVGLISLHDPSQMLPELERVVGFGFRGVMLRPNPIQGRTLSDPTYEPFWEACERHSLAVTIHNNTDSYVPSTGSDRFKTHWAQHSCEHPMEQMMALLSLLEGGVLERYPRLRVACLESGCSWLPYWLWRLDDMSDFMKPEIEKHVRMKPSAYFRRQYFVTLEASEPLLPDVIRHLGEDNFLWGSDFPHADHSLDALDEFLALRGQIPDQTLRKIFWDNPARFFGIQE
jgi:predicted TIM-barrel fold metal-dependent hydrolase